MVGKSLVTAMLLGCLVIGMGGQAGAQADPLLGQIAWVPYNFAPRGWALCNGQLLPISQYTALFALLDTNYGGDGRTTFALPNLQGRVMVHQDEDFPLGSQGGAASTTLSVAQLPAHSHSLNASSMAGGAINPTGNVLAKASAPLYRSAGAANATMAGRSIGSTGENAPIPTMPPYTTLTCIIALTGVFPSQN